MTWKGLKAPLIALALNLTVGSSILHLTVHKCQKWSDFSKLRRRLSTHSILLTSYTVYWYSMWK